MYDDLIDGVMLELNPVDGEDVGNHHDSLDFEYLMKMMLNLSLKYIKDQWANPAK